MLARPPRIAPLLILGLVVAPPAVAAPAEADEAQALVTRWLDAQNAGDFAGYSAFYATGFAGVRRSGERVVQLDREGWLRDRARMFKKKMTVGASELRAVPVGEGVEVRFRQTFESGSYRDAGEKKLLLAREGGALRIAREEMLSSEKLAPSPPGSTSPPPTGSGSPPPPAARQWVSDPLPRSRYGDPRARVTLSMGHLERSATGRVTVELRASFTAPVPKDWQKCQYLNIRPDGQRVALAPLERTVAGSDGWAVRLALDAPAPVEKFTVSCPEVPDAPVYAFGLGAPPNAWLVAIDLGGDPRKAEQEFAKNESLPRHNDFPLLVASEWILGLAPGRTLAIVAAADDGRVAKALATALGDDGVDGVVVKRAWWPDPEPLRLLVVVEVVDRKKNFQHFDNPVAELVQEGPPGEPYPRRIRSGANLLVGGLILPYTLGSGLLERMELGFGGVQSAGCKDVVLSNKLMQKSVASLGSARTSCEWGD